MCNDTWIAFGKAHLHGGDVRGKDVIEIGAQDVNGSLRQAISALEPASYLGTDIAGGPGVDEECSVVDLEARYGQARFDVAICTEVLEHVRDWRSAIRNMKAILRPGGVLLVTTRSKGFPYHGYPFDFWRYEVSDFETMFRDLKIEALEPDPAEPGVFMKARKATASAQADLASHELYSIISKRRCREVADFDIALLRLRHASRAVLSSLTPATVKEVIRKVYPSVSTTWRD